MHVCLHTHTHTCIDIKYPVPLDNVHFLVLEQMIVSILPGIYHIYVFINSFQSNLLCCYIG